MFELIILGFLMAAALVALIFRIGAKTVFGYGALADLAAMALLALLFHGTFAGMSVAIIAGLFFSGAIYVVRRQIGYRTFSLSAWTWLEVAPDPIRMPDKTPLKPTGFVERLGLWVMVYLAVLVLLMTGVGTLIGSAMLLMMPFVVIAAAAITPLITRRIT